MSPRGRNCAATFSPSAVSAAMFLSVALSAGAEGGITRLEAGPAFRGNSWGRSSVHKRPFCALVPAACSSSRVRTVEIGRVSAAVPAGVGGVSCGVAWGASGVTLVVTPASTFATALASTLPPHPSALAIFPNTNLTGGAATVRRASAVVPRVTPATAPTAAAPTTWPTLTASFLPAVTSTPCLMVSVTAP